MLYKELQGAKRKFIPILLIYILVGVLVSTLFSPHMTFSGNSVFHNWVVWMIFITIGAAVLGGSDTIAEETGKNTLSFLLTRPISRPNIYAIKFLVSATFLSAIIIATSVVMFLVEQLPQGYNYGSIVFEGEVARTVTTYIPIDKISAGEAFTCIAVILGIGLAVLALTTLVSIFSRSAINTIVTTILIGCGLIAIYAFTDLLFRFNNLVSSIFNIEYGLGFWDFFILLAIAVGIFMAGLKIFKAKEF